MHQIGTIGKQQKLVSSHNIHVMFCLHFQKKTVRETYSPKYKGKWQKKEIQPLFSKSTGIKDMAPRQSSISKLSTALELPAFWVNSRTMQPSNKTLAEHSLSSTAKTGINSVVCLKLSVLVLNAIKPEIIFSYIALAKQMKDLKQSFTWFNRIQASKDEKTPPHYKRQ